MRALTRARARRLEDPEEGSILLAMMGMFAMTSVMLVLLATIISGANVDRHDAAFELSLHAAEEGMDLQVAKIRQTPLASTFPALADKDTATNASYSSTVTGGSGHWTVRSSGTATNGNKTVTRTITQKVDSSSPLTTPLVGKDGLTLGGPAGASGVETYDSSVSSATCDTGGLPLGLNSLVTLGTTAKMCTNASPATAGAMTEGPLTMKGADLSKFSGVDIYGASAPGFNDPTASGSCVGDSTACASSKVQTHQTTVPLPLSSLCSNGIGGGVAAYDGSTALAANAVYNFTDVTLNATAIANLQNLGATQLVICFSGKLIIPPAVALNTTVGSVLPPRLDPRPPSTLLLISTDPGPGKPAPEVDLGLDTSVAGIPIMSTLETSISSVIYAPNATCQAAGHVDVFGTLICGTVNAANGVSVHYDTQIGTMNFGSTVAVSAWHEETPGS